MIDINLLPYEQKVSRKLIWTVSIIAGLCLALFIALTVYAWHLNSELHSLQKQESVWKTKASEKINLSQPKLSTKPTPADAVRTILTGRDSIFESWTNIHNLLPPDGTLVSIVYTMDGKMTLQCNLASFSEIDPFVSRLRNKGFTSVVLTQAAKPVQAASSASGGYQITLTMNTHFSIPINQKKGQ
jgi:hypothetical protein